MQGEAEEIDITEEDITIVAELKEVATQDGKVAVRVRRPPPRRKLEPLRATPAPPPATSSDPFFRAVKVVIEQARLVLADQGLRQMEIEMFEWSLRERIAKL